MIIWITTRIFELLYGVTIAGDVLNPILLFGYVELMLELIAIACFIGLEVTVRYIKGGKS